MNLIPHLIIISKIINRITIKKNYFYQFLPLKWIIKVHVKKIIAKANKEKIQQNLQRILGSFENFQDEIKNLKDSANVIACADVTLAHKFDYLGSGLTKLDPIDWHIDFKSGFKWPRGKFYKKYVTVDLSNNADVKVPWELSRCHHLLWLGEAYLITRDEKYAKEVVEQIKGWIDENPLMYSINWTCAMDVAIRAINWMYAVNMIKSSSHITDLFAKNITKSLFEHGFYIYNNLEKEFPYSANHYASDIVGLLFIGQYFNEFNYGKKWYSFALSEYFSEVRQQILPTGVNFERTISYHRLMTELFAYSFIMLSRLGVTIPIDVRHRVKSMFGFILNYTKPNGLSPVIGDNDDGRLLPFVKYDFRDHRYLLGMEGLIFNETINQRYSTYGSIDSFFLLNCGAQYERFSHGFSNSLETSSIYQDAGFAILRKNDLFLFFSNSCLSRNPNLLNKIHGTHTHADALSFELCIGGNDLIIDPGSYVYTSLQTLRNEYRSTRKHNTVCIDGDNQLELLKENPFCVKGYHEPKVITYSKNYESQKLDGEFKWYLPTGEIVIHKRSIEIFNNYLQIDDDLIASKPHIYTWYFHFAPGIVVEKRKDSIVLISAVGNEFSIRFICPIRLDIEIIEDTFSPSYGVLIPSKTLLINAKGENDVRVRTLIEVS